MANTNIDGTISTLFHGMDGFGSSKSGLGEPIKVGDTIIIPLLDVNFGMAAGAFNKQTGNNAAGGIGAKLSPAAVLVISNGKTRLVNIKNQDTVTKILDMIPDVIDKFKGKDEKVVTDADIDEAIEDAAE
mgnify:CR=1 FL=1